MFALGVDLGTSHTVAMLRRSDGRTRPLLFDGQPLLPSAVFADRTGKLHVGRDAVRLGYAEPDRFEPHPKRHVDAASMLLGGADVPVPDAFAALLGAVAREAVATCGFLPAATLTYPAAWGSARRQVLVEAIARAGWPASTELVAEPVAAARYFASVLRRPVPVGSSLAVFDFGAGTLDIAVVRNAGGGRYEVTASGGRDDLGGLDLDAALVDHLGKSLSGGEPEAWRALTAPTTLAQWRARRTFWDDVRGAKEMLSRSVLAPVPVPGVEAAVHLTRDELEAAIDPLIRRAVAETGTVLSAAGVSPSDLAGLFLVGGSSRVPMVARLLHGRLGIAPTVLEQPELPVAEGAVTDSAGPSGSDAATTSAPPAADVSGPAPAPPAVPAARPAADEEEYQYSEPVDPWATAEAEAIAAHGGQLPGAPFPGGRTQNHAPTPTPPDSRSWLASAPEQPRPAEAATRPRPYRKWVLISAAGLVVVLAIGLTVVLWPRYRAIAFTPLADPVRIASPVAIGYSFSRAAVLGDRAYFAAADDNGRLGVVAEKLSGGRPIWSNTAAGTAGTWQTMVALPNGIALFTGTDADSRRRVVVLNADNGRKRWERTIDGQDAVYFTGDMAILDDRKANRLLGVKVAGSGATAWELPNVKTTYGSTAEMVLVSTPDDLTGPADTTGRPFAPNLGDDTRIVQISEDKSARVIDAATGTVVVDSQPGIASGSDQVIAHDGRLIVYESSNNRIVTYDLKTLGEPTGRYTVSTSGGRLDQLTPCGRNRVCVIETAGSGGKTARVVAIDVAKGGHWSTTVPDADTLLPVGESLLVGRNTSPDSVSLLNGDGRIVWTRDGTAGRLDAGNLLLFSKSLSTGTDDPALTGQHLGDEVKPLGALADIRTSSCAWNTATLACVGDKDFELIRFAK